MLWSLLMRKLFLTLHVKLFTLANGEEGQSLIEFALLTALIALAVTAGAHKEATAVHKLFTKVGTDFKKY